MDLDRLQSTLSNSKLQVSNNAAYQTILGLINGARGNSETLGQLQTLIEEVQTQIEGFGSINVVEVHPAGGPVSLSLGAYVSGMTMFKDMDGAAGANNITLVGTVEGTVDPVINTNFGNYKVFIGRDGLFYTWT